MLELFVLINFIVSAFSDIALNMLSRLKIAPDAVKVLKPYFAKHGMAVAASYAGITVVSVLVVTMAFSKFVFNFAHPRTWTQLGKFLLLAAPLGYIADILIYRFQLFGNSLNAYYQKAGQGLWGSAAFIFSILFYKIEKTSFIISWSYKRF